VPGAIGGSRCPSARAQVPHPSFAPLAALFLATSVAAVPPSRRLKGDWVGWSAFTLSALVLSVWAVRIRVSLSGVDPTGPPAGTEWFPPFVWLFALFWLAQSLLGTLRPPRAMRSLLSLALPSLGAAVAFSAGLQVAAAQGTPSARRVGLLLAAALVGVAAWAGLKGGAGRGAQCLRGGRRRALRLVLGRDRVAARRPAAASITAFAFAVSPCAGRAAARLVSYLLQIFVALGLAGTLRGGGTAKPRPRRRGLPGARAVGVCPLSRCRRHAPAPGSLVFQFLGGGDRCSIALLTSSLAGGFFLLRTAAYLLLGGGVTASRDAFLSAQSLIISVSGVVLFAMAARSHSRELRTVAVLVTLVGAAKVFLYDLIAVHGVSRLVSVFSFGLLAAVASVVLGRWHRREPS
jgi:hypothetical protein